jgi:cleavage and polyadenylation specificity factor subunit 2
LLIADAKGALEVHSARKQRDSDFVEASMASLKAGGTVLVPVDSAGRSLEILQIVESHWTSNKVSYPVFFLSHQSQRVVDLAKGMLEWTSQTFAKIFEQDRSNPFDLRTIRIVHSLEQVASVAGPKMIISSLSSLDTGFALTLLPEILAQSSSAVIFTTKSDAESMAAKVLSCSKGTNIVVTFSEQVPLEGDELQKFREAEREATELEAAEAAFVQLQRQREDETGSEEETEVGETEAAGQAKRLEQEQINSAAALQNFYWTDYRQDWFVNQEMLPSPINSPFYPMIPPDMAMLPSGVPLRHQVFPFREKRYLSDAYGEFVDPADFRPKVSSSASEATVPVTPLIQAIAPIPEPGKKPAIPMKWITRTSEVAVKSTRKFVDFSGVSDGRSLKTIYSRVQPRRLLLVGGSPESTDYLMNHFQQTTASRTMEVFAPSLMETVTVSSAVNVMQAILAESLISQLQLQLLGEYELAWVRGAVKIPEDGEVDEEPHAKRAAAMIVLTAVESKSTPIMIGDPRLSEMRRLIQNELKIPAVFDSGDLVCGVDERRVVIRRDASGALTLEGPLCSEYYSVRSILYSSVAFLQ